MADTIRDAPAGYAPVDLASRYAEALGPVWRDASRGRLALHVDDRHANPVGVCHGGAIATFADAQLVAVADSEPSGQPHTPTSSLSVDYLAPAPLGAWLEMEVRLTKRTAAMLFTDAVMFVGDEVVARSSAIYRRSPKRS